MLKKDPLSGFLLIFSAPSGAGKTSLCRRLVQEFENLSLAISTTTRAPREQEKEGVDYFFLSHTEFEKKITEGDFAEWAQVHGELYGTSRQLIEQKLAKGNSLLLNIDVQGAARLKVLFPDQTLLIFVVPPSLKELERRLRKRATDSEESIQRRLKNAKKELLQKEKFDFILLNAHFETAFLDLKNWLLQHGLSLQKKNA